MAAYSHPRPNAPYRSPNRRRRRFPVRILLPLLVLLTLACAGRIWDVAASSNEAAAKAETLSGTLQVPADAPATEENAPAANNTTYIPTPEWIDVDLLPVNEYSRPGDALPQVNGVVVHYVGNPGTTAKQNRSFFENLATTHETYASSHFVVGMDGEIIQCVPLQEISYCSSNRNSDTIAIECCHPDADGKFRPETVSSLKKLLNWLIQTYGLEREDILRHYDVTGKVCPRYFVDNPDAWEELLDELTFTSGSSVPGA